MHRIISIRTREMRDSEKLIEKQLVKEIKAMSGMCIKLLTNFLVGLPDRLILLPGARIYFVETKSQGDKPRLIQVKIHKDIAKLGFDVRVIDSKEKLNDFIKEIKPS